MGGGACSDVWCQIYADVLGVEVRQVEDPLQANARGAGLLAAIGQGRVGWVDVPALARVHRTFEPNPAHRALYDDRFAAFTEIHRRMAPLYRRLNQSARAEAPIPSATGTMLQP